MEEWSMSIVILEDNENRIKTFKFKLKHADPRIVTTAIECIDLLKIGKHINILFLDHDLGGAIYVDSKREDCGMEVVRFMIHNNCNVDKIICHSLNGPARHDMCQNLKWAGYNAEEVPFIFISWDKINNYLQRFNIK